MYFFASFFTRTMTFEVPTVVRMFVGVYLVTEGTTGEQRRGIYLCFFKSFANAEGVGFHE